MRSLEKSMVMLVLFTFIGAACSTVLSRVPLPEDVKVVAPQSDLPADVKAYSGKWCGTWDNGLEHVLVVEKIDFPNVEAVYATGALASGGIESGFRRTNGRIEDGQLNLFLGATRIWYILQPDGSLEANLTRDFKVFLKAKMTRLSS